MSVDLPDEVWEDIVDYLEPEDIISLLLVSQTVSKIARGNHIWKHKCFERSPSASSAPAHLPRVQSHHQYDRQHPLASQTGQIQGIPAGRTISTQLLNRPKVSKRYEAISRWDQTGPMEKLDWYSDYVARHAPLSVVWHKDVPRNASEIRGVAAYGDSTRALACRLDGSMSVFDIEEPSMERRYFTEIERTPPSVLFHDRTMTSGSSRHSSSLDFNWITECICTDSRRGKAYLAVRDMLNEVDLDTMQVISQTKYAWPITALSQERSRDAPLSVGTTWSLHVHDPRQAVWKEGERSEHRCDNIRNPPEDSIAFFTRPCKSGSFIQSVPAQSVPYVPYPTGMDVEPGNSQTRNEERRALSDFARAEPGPLSILHEGDHDIFIAGRFPTIMSYDRRSFPKLQYVIHSGARLSALTSIPYPPKADHSRSRFHSTLVACGEYNGRGSLEIYSLPHVRSTATASHHTSETGVAATTQSESVVSAEPHPYSYRNRQEAASSKLLAVAVHGSRIVFSDANGGLKWVERDGRGLVRRWNINPWQVNDRGGSVSGEQVVRKMVPLSTQDSAYGTRGDNDLLIWTGESMGIVTTKSERSSHADLVRSFEDRMEEDGEEDLSQKEREYSRTMRLALERQADERRWMGRFQFKRRFG